MKLLIIEDDRRLAALMADVLAEEHISVDMAHDGDAGLDMVLSGRYDVAIIDWMLPGKDGPSICRAVRAGRLSTALLMLTARGQIEDRVAGLDSGSDDYLTKPFSFDELLARVRTLGRRFNLLLADASELRAGDVVLDVRLHLARRGNRELDLTPTEWRLMELLIRHPGQALTRQQILDYVWSYDNDVQQTMVDVYVSYLRQKLNVRGEADPIQTVRGIGYRLKSPDV